MNIRERIAQNASYKAEMNAMLSALKEGETLSGEQQTKFDEFKGKIQANLDVIAKAAEVTSFEGVKAPVVASTETSSDFRATDEYKKGFNVWLRSRGRTVPDVLATLSESALVTDGFELPTQFSNDIITLANGDAPTFGLVNVVPTTQPLVLPVESAKGSAGATSEGSAYHNSDGSDDPTIASITIGAYKLTRTVALTEESFSDIPALQGYVTNNLGTQIGEGTENWLVNGNGTTQPQGVVTGASAGVTTASTTDITYNELVALVSKPKSAYLNGASFLMHRSTLAYLAGLTNELGLPVFPDLFGSKRIFGYSVAISDAMPTMAAGAKAIIFGNFKRAATCGVRTGIQVRIVDQENAKLGIINFYGSRRLDQKVLVPEAIKLLTMKAS